MPKGGMRFTPDGNHLVAGSTWQVLPQSEADEGGPISTEGWTRRVHFVREGGGGGGGSDGEITQIG